MDKGPGISGSLRRLAGSRILILVILVLILAGLCVYYNDLYFEKVNVPSSIVNHSGDAVTVSGEVISIEPDGFVIKYISNYRIESPLKVSMGDEVQVIGILDTGNTIINTRIFVLPKWDYIFVFVRSIFGLLLVMVLFFRYWTFNFKEKVFLRRK